MNGKVLVIALATLALAACNQTTSQSNDPPATEPVAEASSGGASGTGAQIAQASTGAIVNLVFLDLTGFDDDLSSSLSARPEEVVVDFPGKTTLNELPTRLDPWFSKVKDSGGQVAAFPAYKEGEERSRGIVGVLIDVAQKAHEAYAFKEKLAPAEAYDVQLEYDEDTGRVYRARFIHK